MKRIPTPFLVAGGLVLMAAGGAYLAFVGPWSPAGRVITEADRRRAAKSVAEGTALYNEASNPACRTWDARALDSLRCFRLAINADPDNLDAQVGAARAALLVGRTGPAMDHADAILGREPGHMLAHEVRAEAEWMMAFEMDGYILPRPVARLAKTRTPPVPDLATQMRRKAAEDFAAAGAVSFPLREAEARYRAGDLDQAEALAKTANPRLSERDFLLAMIRMERGEDPTPLLEPLAVRQFTPALMIRARFLMESGEWEKLRVDGEILHDAHMEWPDPWLYWGTACLRLGRLAEARDAFKKLSVLDAELAKPGAEETRVAIAKMEAEGKIVAPPPPIKFDKP